MGFAERFKALREEKRMTLAEVANKVGVSEATAQRWESGNIKQVRYGRIDKLAEALGTTPAYLMGYDEQEKPQQEPMTEEEEQFLVILRQLSPQGRAAAAQMLQSLRVLQEQSSATRE